MIDLTTSLRLVSAQETLSAITPFLGHYDIHGYVDHTLDGFDLLRSVEVVRGNPRSGFLNLGKGYGIEAALASGYMEAIEVRTIEVAPEISCHETPPGASVYRLVNKACTRNEGDWDGVAMVSGTDLLTGETVYTPVEDLFLPQNGTDTSVTTNGLASGNALAEARLHALYELIERQVTAEAYAAPGRITQITFDEIPAPLRGALLETASNGMQGRFFHLGDAMGVTVVQCALHSDRAAGGEVHFGWGAHHSPVVAVARALSEAMQAWATRHAIKHDNLPLDRMPGGLLIAANQLHALKSASTAGEWKLLDVLLSRPLTALALQGVQPVPPDPEIALDRLLSWAQAERISHVLSWTLSPEGRPFAVVKCEIPEFTTPFPEGAVA